MQSDRQQVVIVAAARTAIGNFGGALAGVAAPELGAAVIAALLERAGVDGQQIDEVMMGNVLTAGLGQNPARQAAIKAGLPVAVPALTINQVCGSGLKAVHLAAQAIALGDAGCVIAGGQENMSRAPYLLAGARQGLKPGNVPMVDSMLYDGLTDVYQQCAMGVTAENLATRYGVSREEQDAYALASQQKAAAAQVAGRFASEIVPVEIPRKRGEIAVFAHDEFIKAETTAAALAGLRPAFHPQGTVTAGNASGINDGAAAVLLMSAARAAELGLTPLAVIRGYASAGVEPAWMGLGPIDATRRCLAQAGWSVHDLDLIEGNEAFAVQSLAVSRELGWDSSKLNVNGGAIALGHPIGASGCRILVTLLYEMQRRAVRRGLATLCIGGGMGVALAVERCDSDRL